MDKHTFLQLLKASSLTEDLEVQLTNLAESADAQLLEEMAQEVQRYTSTEEKLYLQASDAFVDVAKGVKREERELSEQEDAAKDALPDLS